jgi:hypothetical protein
MWIQISRSLQNIFKKSREILGTESFELVFEVTISSKFRSHQTKWRLSRQIRERFAKALTTLGDKDQCKW